MAGVVNVRIWEVLGKGLMMATTPPGTFTGLACTYIQAIDPAIPSTHVGSTVQCAVLAIEIQPVETAGFGRWRLSQVDPTDKGSALAARSLFLGSSAVSVQIDIGAASICRRGLYSETVTRYMYCRQQLHCVCIELRHARLLAVSM